MSVIKFLLDENVDDRLRSALHQHGRDVVVSAVGDPLAPPKMTLDPDILLWCETYDFALVTNNRASMPVHLKAHIANGHHVPGIFILNPHMSLIEIVKELATIAGASREEEYADRKPFYLLSSNASISKLHATASTCVTTRRQAQGRWRACDGALQAGGRDAPL